ncbi:MAG: PAS-domain containing protein [Pararhodobacter sp.]|nr:PAS-domain containing protein [Pararhodobacter sp.]
MLAEANEKLTRAGLNLIQQALSIFDSDLRLAVCNQRYQEMFGLPDRLVTPGATFEDTIRYLVNKGEYGPQPDPEEAVRVRVETARAFEPHYMERQRANGRWISVEGAPLPQGGWVTVYTDITEIKLQEQLLRARSEELSGQLFAHAERLSLANRELAAMNAALEQAKRELTEIEARTRLTTEMMPAHIAHVNRDLVYTYSNRRLSSIMPGVPGDVVGLHAAQALGMTFERIRPHMQRALDGESAVCEITHEESGRRIRVALTPDPGLVDNSGQEQGGGIYILSTDITEETQARAALMQTRKRELAAQLTSGLAHDFSNLLTIILGMQEKLHRLPGLPAEGAELVRATLGAARRGGTLLQRIGAISGPRELRAEPTDLAGLLDDLALLAGPSLPDATRLGIECEDGLGAVLLDQGAVQDSLLNLILNARDAMGEAGGEIRLSLRRRRDTWLEFTVEDDGPGFSPEALKHGLDPFFTTKRGAGSGLGLAMVYDHATLCGGSVRLANRSGGGARVTLRLPLRLAQPQQHGHLVLLVEDDADIRTHVRDMLCAQGHAVLEAESAQDAEALAEIEGIGMVLSDIDLRGGDSGLTLLRRLRARLPAIAMGLMTSLPPGAALHMEGARHFPVLRKPFGPEALGAFLGRCEVAPGRSLEPLA